VKNIFIFPFAAVEMDLFKDEVGEQCGPVKMSGERV